MSDIKLLKKMLSTNAFTEVDHLGILELKEDSGKEDSGKGYSVIIEDVPPHTIAIKTDKFPVPKGFFKSKKGEGKRGDYVIINEDKINNIMLFIYIEMKRRNQIDNPTARDIYQQLSGSYCIIQYCKVVGKIFRKRKNFLKSSGGCKHLFFFIDCSEANKTTTEIKPIGVEKLRKFPPILGAGTKTEVKVIKGTGNLNFDEIIN